MKRNLVCGTLVACAVVACAEEIEGIRAAAAALRARDPQAFYVARGTVAEANAFAATGEAEEADAWRVTEPLTAEARAALRKTFDGAGGKGRPILAADEPFTPSVYPACAPFAGEKPAYDVLVAGSGRLVRLAPDGKVVWTRPGCGNVQQVRVRDGYAYWSNGSLWRVRLGAAPTEKSECVFKPANPAGGAALGFDFTPSGALVVADNVACEILTFPPHAPMPYTAAAACVRVKVDARDAQGKLPPPHFRLRLVRYTPAGTYLVCCALAGCVREYDKAGRLVWEQKAPPFVFDCLRRANGNTVISHLTGVTEFAPDHARVWSFACTDAPALKLANLCGLAERPSGELLIGTWANGMPDGSAATALCVARDKRIVWSQSRTGDVNMMGVQALATDAVR